MPKVREVLAHVSVETAERRRICHRNRESHAIAKGEPCLVIREAASSGSKNYCRVCAAPILGQAAQDLVDLRAALGLAVGEGAPRPNPTAGGMA
jgi:hypothetical protein